MRFRVISDTHDRAPHIVEAVKMFNDRGVDAVLHCGDFVSPFSLEPFEELKCPLYAVFGNNDGEEQGIKEMFDRNGWTLNNRPYRLDVNGVSIAMLHEPAPLDRILSEQPYDLVVFGHTHEPYSEQRENTLVVNPGEGCGWVKGRSTLAFVDTAVKSIEICNINA